MYWKGSGPLFFYTGNEGAIDGFYDNTGFLFELAQNFSALVVFAEHVSLFVRCPFARHLKHLHFPCQCTMFKKHADCDNPLYS